MENKHRPAILDSRALSLNGICRLSSTYHTRHHLPNRDGWGEVRATDEGGQHFNRQSDKPGMFMGNAHIASRLPVFVLNGKGGLALEKRKMIDGHTRLLHYFNCIRKKV